MSETVHNIAPSPTGVAVRSMVWSIGLMVVLCAVGILVRPGLQQVIVPAGVAGVVCILLTGPLLAVAVRFPLHIAAPAVLALAGLRIMTMLLACVVAAMLFDAPWRWVLSAGVPLYFVILASETVPLARLFWTLPMDAPDSTPADRKTAADLPRIADPELAKA